MNKGLLETIRDREFIATPSSFTMETLETIIKDLSKKHASTPRYTHFPRFISNQELACMTVEEKRKLGIYE